MLFLTTVALALASVASGQTFSIPVPNTSTGTAAVSAELATATPQSPVSNVKGKVFDRLIVLMMENTDLTVAMENRRFPSTPQLPKEFS
jgi:hypothetical protein